MAQSNTMTIYSIPCFLDFVILVRNDLPSSRSMASAAEAPPAVFNLKQGTPSYVLIGVNIIGAILNYPWCNVDDPCVLWG